MADSRAGYSELQVTSNFTFLEGGSHPEELVERAARLGLAAIALTDRNSFAGIVRAHVAAKEVGIRFIVGVRIDLAAALKLAGATGSRSSWLLFPENRAAYGRLSRLISLGRRRAPKGDCELHLEDVAGFWSGSALVALPPEKLDGAYEELLDHVAALRKGDLYLAASRRYSGVDEERLDRLASLAARTGTRLLATNDVYTHVPERKPLLDVLTCIRHGTTIDRAGLLLEANAERHLKPPEEMARLFRDHPEAIACTMEIAARCRFSLDELRYEYPDEVSEGEDPQQRLAYLTGEGARERYPDGVPPKVEAQVEHELQLIARLHYAPYFLTVYDIVRFARSRGILCQGRGSAANSAVCYCLGITAVDPSRTDLLFERFVSEARGEPPDIDVDFEHERREEVIQYIYAKYGRERAGLAATVIRYRSRSAIREVGKALGLSEDMVASLSEQVWGWSRSGLAEERVREIGLDPSEGRLSLALSLTRQLVGFPRHLSQHVGGFVMTRGRLDELVPVENAAMAERTVVEWDKDDLEALGILKVDVLGLGMLSCVRRAFTLMERHYKRSLSLATVPAEDPAVYDMLCLGDSLGVFQVESRAQMAMLPRLKPRNFYDLVIEVAIVRPGPIQGDMVHPYLRRRNGEEVVSYPSKALRQVLGKTLGVPLFQEQAMKIAIVAAGFSAAEADRLRKSMATFKKNGDIHKFREKLVDGMVVRGYEAEFAERCFKQIEGFGTYGFPESHAASFALLVYVSSWLKCHYPAVFAAALLNSQPMGFYAPAQIVRDAREHGVEVLAPDVNLSGWDSDLEPGRAGRLALRLGLRQIKGLSEEDAERLVACRGEGYGHPLSLWSRAGLGAGVLEALARGDAFASMGMSRREVFWAVRALPSLVASPLTGEKGKKGQSALPLFEAAERRDGISADGVEPEVHLPAAPLGEEVVDDYAALRLSLKAHPLQLLRASLSETGFRPCSMLEKARAGLRVRLAGLVLVRQRPGTAKGVIFITMEDESGIANLVVWPDAFERLRRIVLTSKLIGVTGRVQREGRVIHVVVEELQDLSGQLALLTDGSLDPARFEVPIANADEVRNPGVDLRHETKAAEEEARLDTERRQALGKEQKPLGTHPRNMSPDLRPAPENRRKPDLRVVSRNFH